MNAKTTLLFLLFLIVIAPVVDAQRGRGRGRGARRAVDPAEARARILDPKTEDRRAAFTGLVMAVTREATRRDIPNFWDDPENLYLEEYRALREEFYGPLRADPVGRRFLMELAADTGTDSDFASSSACVYLADDPRVEELAAMAAGYAGLAEEHGRRTSRARHLGRAVAALRGSDAAAPIVRRILKQWEAELESPEPRVAAAALEGLSRAGERDAVVDVLHALTSAQPDRRAREIVQQSTRLLQSLEPGDPSRLRALEWVKESLREAPGGSGRSQGAELLGASSPDAIRFRESVLFLASIDPAESLDALLECYDDPARARQMGIDGLQSLRTRLQSYRQKAEGDDAIRIDEYFWSVLRDTAERLFVLEEEPMTVAEQAGFWAHRDVRYNAASYFHALWDSTPEVREVLDADPDAGDFLVQLTRTTRDEVAGKGANRLWSRVADKEETRVLCAAILVRAERDLGFDEVDGLDQELLDVLTRQVGAEAVALEAIAAAVARYRDLDSWYSIPVVRAPEDGYVRDRAIGALRDLGFELESGRRRILIRPSR